MKKYTRTFESVKRLMRSIAKKEGVRLDLLGPDEGRGGYNYGGSTGDSIYLAPFVKAKAGEKVDGHAIDRDCDNPIECMLISFFHELSHCVLADRVPSNVENYAWNDTSTYQYELWITMLGAEYAHSKYGVKFSDQAMRWMLNEAQSYIHEYATGNGYGLVCAESTAQSYMVVSEWDFQGDKEEDGQ